MIKNINHIAIIVPDLEGALAFWEGALGLKVGGREAVPAEGVDVAFLPIGESNVELLKPTVADSGVARFLEKRGPGIHHMCFEVDDIEATLAQLRAHNIQPVSYTHLDVYKRQPVMVTLAPRLKAGGSPSRIGWPLWNARGPPASSEALLAVSIRS